MPIFFNTRDSILPKKVHKEAVHIQSAILFFFCSRQLVSLFVSFFPPFSFFFLLGRIPFVERFLCSPHWWKRDVTRINGLWWKRLRGKKVWMFRLCACINTFWSHSWRNMKSYCTRFPLFPWLMNFRFAPSPKSFRFSLREMTDIAGEARIVHNDIRSYS